MVYNVLITRQVPLFYFDIEILYHFFSSFNFFCSRCDLDSNMAPIIWTGRVVNSRAIIHGVALNFFPDTRNYPKQHNSSI